MADRYIPIRETQDYFQHQDRFSRKNFVEMLEKIISNTQGPFVININADWGRGKTFLLKMLAERKINEYIYVNTYENDYYDEPFTAIAGEIISFIKGKNPGDEIAKKVVSKAGELAKIVAKNALPLLIKAGIKALAGDKASDKVVESFEASLNEYGTSLIDNHEERKKGMEELRKCLSEYVENEKRKKIVFLIDELDRCKPDYAMEFLELLKHLFDIEGIVFIIATATKRLAKSVESFYGIEDGYLYLKKFFNITLDLPAYSAKEYVEKRLSDSVSIWAGELDTSETGIIIREISQMCDDSRIDIRTIEECLNGFIIGILLREKAPPASLRVYSFYLILLHAISIVEFDKIRLKPEIPITVANFGINLNEDKLHLVKSLIILQRSHSSNNFQKDILRDEIYGPQKILYDVIDEEVEENFDHQYVSGKKALENYIREFQVM